MNIVALTTAQNSTPNPEQVTKAVGGMAEIIDNYGGYIAILAVFILLFIFIVIGIIILNNRMMKASLEEKLTLLNKQSSQNDKLLDHILNDDDDKDEKKEEREEKSESVIKRDLVDTYIDINIILKDAIRTALNELNAERVAIYVFHNGNKSIHGLPFFKLSCIHEWNKVGSMAMKTRAYRSITHHSMPLYLLSDIVEDIYANGRYYISDVQKKKDNSNCLQAFLEHSDVESMYAVAIKDDNDNIAGFVIAEFKDNIDFNNSSITEKIQSILEKTRDTVKPVVINLNGKYSLSHEEEFQMGTTD